MTSMYNRTMKTKMRKYACLVIKIMNHDLSASRSDFDVGPRRKPSSLVTDVCNLSMSYSETPM